MKKLFFLFFFITVQAFSQSSINEYKYIDVPRKYDFLKSEDKYQLNSLTRHLFKKDGFNVLPAENNHPDDYRQDWCLALRVNVVSNSGMFSTKLKIELIDCKGKVVFTSKEGKSREKDYKDSYHEALRNAFKSIEVLNYVYTPKVQQTVNLPKPIVSSQPVVSQTTPIEKQVVQIPVETVVNENTLYAQPTANGYQLVDMSPKVVFVLKKTSIKDVYLIEGKDGTVSYKDGKWVAEYYEGEELIHEILSIKF